MEDVCAMETSWEHLATFKESNPVEVAEYTVAHQLVSEPAFAWWVLYTLKKRTQIVASVFGRYTLYQKFGVQLTRSVQEALAIDAAANTTYSQDAINLEIKNVDAAFQDLD
jgi:hypothetical protein